MMIEQARVVAYQNGIATVQCVAKRGCGGCSAQSACGTKSLSALSGEKRAPQWTLAVDQPLNVGDAIEIGIAEQSVLVAVGWLYALPLLVLLTSTLLLSHWLENELMMAGGIFACTATAFMVIKIMLGRRSRAPFVPRFLRKI